MIKRSPCIEFSGPDHNFIVMNQMHYSWSVSSDQRELVSGRLTGGTCHSLLILTDCSSFRLTCQLLLEKATYSVSSLLLESLSNLQWNVTYQCGMMLYLVFYNQVHSPQVLGARWSTHFVQFFRTLEDNSPRSRERWYSFQSWSCILIIQT